MLRVCYGAQRRVRRPPPALLPDRGDEVGDEEDVRLVRLADAGHERVLQPPRVRRRVGEGVLEQGLAGEQVQLPVEEERAAGGGRREVVRRRARRAGTCTRSHLFVLERSHVVGMDEEVQLSQGLPMLWTLEVLGMLRTRRVSQMTEIHETDRRDCTPPAGCLGRGLVKQHHLNDKIDARSCH
eukprot:gene17902-biopygen2155